MTIRPANSDALPVLDAEQRAQLTFSVNGTEYVRAYGPVQLIRSNVDYIAMNENRYVSQSQHEAEVRLGGPGVAFLELSFEEQERRKVIRADVEQLLGHAALSSRQSLPRDRLLGHLVRVPIAPKTVMPDTPPFRIV